MVRVLLRLRLLFTVLDQTGKRLTVSLTHISELRLLLWSASIVQQRIWRLKETITDSHHLVIECISRGDLGIDLRILSKNLIAWYVYLGRSFIILF